MADHCDENLLDLPGGGVEFTPNPGMGVDHCDDGLISLPTDARYLNKEENETELYEDYWEEQISLYGQRVHYYEYGYQPEDHDSIYGEQPTAEFHDPRELIMVCELSNDSILLAQFGIEANAEFTAFIDIKSFERVYGEGAEPKSGDVIKMTEYGSDRVHGRGAPAYEITERDDEIPDKINTLGGHYVWVIRGKRFEYSAERGITHEDRNDQVTDDDRYGRLTSTPENSAVSAAPQGPDKLFDYPEDAVDTKSNIVFDYSAYDVDTSPYGDY